MEQAKTFIKTLLEIAAFITAIGAAWAYIKKWKSESKPAKNSKLIHQHTEQIASLDTRLTALEKTNQKQDQFVTAMCASMLALLDHGINGNSIDKLKQAREEMQEFLIHRGQA